MNIYEVSEGQELSWYSWLSVCQAAVIKESGTFWSSESLSRQEDVLPSSLGGWWQVASVPCLLDLSIGLLKTGQLGPLRVSSERETDRQRNQD